MGEKEIMSEERRGVRRGTEREVNAGASLENLLVRYLFVDCVRSGDREVEEGEERGKERKSGKVVVGRLRSVFRYAIFV
jgi:hypothetical protein